MYYIDIYIIYIYPLYSWWPTSKVPGYPYHGLPSSPDNHQGASGKHRKNNGNLWKIHHFWWVIYGKSSFYSYIYMTSWEYIYIYLSPDVLARFRWSTLSISTPSGPVPAPLGPETRWWRFHSRNLSFTGSTWCTGNKQRIYPNDPYLNNSRNMIYIY